MWEVIIELKYSWAFADEFILFYKNFFFNITYLKYVWVLVEVG